jgi:DNA-binding transcriptional LysR family regulator
MSIITAMNDRNIDLNLFHIFYAVMTERNVTRAAEHLAMTQPAVSNALSRLRLLFQDDLFTKVHGGVRPTKRALAIWPDIQEALSKVRGLFGSSDFVPAASRQIFNIAVWDSLRYSLVPALAVHLAEHAPYVTLYVRPQTIIGTVVDLEAGTLDCAVGMFPQLPPGLHVDALFSDDFVCVMRKQNPLSHGHLSLKKFAAADHVLVRSSGSGYGVVDDWLSRKGLTRHISVVVNHFEDALEIARRTNLLATIPRSLLWMMDRAKCRSVTLPRRIQCEMVWHDRTEGNAAQGWLRAVIKNLAMDHSDHPK